MVGTVVSGTVVVGTVVSGTVVVGTVVSGTVVVGGVAAGTVVVVLGCGASSANAGSDPVVKPVMARTATNAAPARRPRTRIAPSAARLDTVRAVSHFCNLRRA
ncbi:MAG TPA: hypothetical protein VFW97_09910 [Acidimicrobiia bacterium]|nr:hypothetical protein [Acidimicrobiia bacterium]